MAVCSKLLGNLRPRKCSGALHAKLCPKLHDLSGGAKLAKLRPFAVGFSDQGPPFCIALDNPVEIVELVLVGSMSHRKFRRVEYRRRM